MDNNECKLKLTAGGQAAVDQLTKRREEVAEAAYGSLTADEQEQLDKLVLKLTQEYESRSVNYQALSDLLA